MYTMRTMRSHNTRDFTCGFDVLTRHTDSLWEHIPVWFRISPEICADIRRVIPNFEARANMTIATLLNQYGMPLQSSSRRGYPTHRTRVDMHR
ncbi:MAG: hypothetical protein J07HQX50_00057 [Haloquadratum sp. J07HQX50]|nr:MAG: hypothetical protein J07HQX50_00057 [Haloquadratum sp. J07HQX50]